MAGLFRGDAVRNCGKPACIRKNSASKARAIAADIAKFAAGAKEGRSLPFEVIFITE
jgi:hypothetical protein